VSQDNQILNEPLNDYYTGKRILITAGPTVEPIDDVRFISNHSSGKMGYALAAKAAEFGAEVILISGPVHIPPPDNVQVVNVTTADDMYHAAIEYFPLSDIAIMTAAVADFTPAEKVSGKIKKESLGSEMILRLVKTKDILAELSATKTETQKVIGFALESENETENGLKKLKKKKCDMIVVNSANKTDSGFGGDKNTITIITAGGLQFDYPPMTKIQCAVEILKTVAAY
jgi:phosphopantothenoylcysteine decarboxylase/phosphopantothenate--cysteine ligase